MRDELLENGLGRYLFVTACFAILAVLNWAIFLRDTIPNPIFLTIIALICFGISSFKFIAVRRQIHHLNRGIAAEKSVGQFLEQFHANGYKVFHDIPGEKGGVKFNIDHVLVGPKGIFTIETNSRNKPCKGECKVLYDGEQVIVNGFPGRRPITQAKAQASWLEDLLKSCTALKSISITPLVVYAGWYVDIY